MNYFLPILITVLFVFFDALFYGIFLEKNIKGITVGQGFMYNKFFDSIYSRFQKPINWLMEEKQIFGFYGPYKYRILQKISEIGFAIFTFKTFGLLCFLMFFGAYYFMTFEYAYYLFLGQRKYIASVINVPWLKKWYFSGFWLFKTKYSFDKFVASFLIGLLFLTISILFSALSY